MSVEALTADGWKVVEATATGPAATVSVGAGTAANVDLAVAANPASIKEVLALKSLSGLPDGVVLVGVSYPSPTTVRVRVFNPTTSDINVTANSVTAAVLAKAA
jgi:hypothetical protein